jgi:polar amino acid transport system permease protein
MIEAELLEVVQRLYDGLLVTLRLIAVSAPAGLALGVLVGLTETYGGRLFRGLAVAYQVACRGVPLVVQLFILYYGLPRLGITMSPFVAAVVGFTLCSGAYHAEYVRSAALSVPDGQIEAGRAVGMTLGQTVRSIVLPQVLRRALPGCGNEIVYLIKYSSLAYLVTLVDLTGQGRLLAYASFRFLETFFVVGLIYLALVALASSLLRAIERRLQIPM